MIGRPEATLRSCLLSVLLFCFSFLLVSPVPALGKFELTPARIAGNLEKHLPRFNGELVAIDGEQFYVAVDAGESVPREVEIYRRELVEGTGGPRLVEEFIGIGQVQEFISSRLARLELSAKVAKKIQVGDKLRPRRLDVVVRLGPGARSRLVREKLGEKLLELRAVRAVKFDTDLTVGDISSPVLTVRRKTVKLSRRGQTGVILCSAADSPREPQPAAKRLKRRVEFDFKLRDFLYFPGEQSDYSRGKLVLGGEQGLARVDVSLTTGVLTDKINWTDVNGEILALNSVGSSEEASTGEFALLVTYSRRGAVYTAFYSWLPSQAKFLEKWRRKHTWIERINGGYYRFRIGLTQPFGPTPVPVTVSERGVESAGEASFPLPGALNPSAVQKVGEHLWFLDGSGRLVVNQADKEIYRSETTFGDGPQTVSARREKYKTTLHPGLSVTSETARQLVLLAANGGGSWNFIRSLQQFTESRLFLFELDPEQNKFRKRWESRRLPGIVESIRSNLVLVVKSESEQSIIYELKF